jgi:hypothetical protein
LCYCFIPAKALRDAQDELDFVPLSMDLVFPSGSKNGSIQCTSISIIGDDQAEGNETFNVVWTVSGPVALRNVETVITITADHGMFTSLYSHVVLYKTGV